MNQKVVPFLLGVALGFGMRWFFHLCYLVAIVAAFVSGKHLHV